MTFLQLELQQALNHRFRPLKRKGMHGWPHSTVDRILVSRPAAAGLIHAIPELFLRKNDVAKIYQQPNA